jgi:hypothetical protein
MLNNDTADSFYLSEGSIVLSQRRIDRLPQAKYKPIELAEKLLLIETG